MTGTSRQEQRSSARSRRAIGAKSLTCKKRCGQLHNVHRGRWVAGVPFVVYAAETNSGSASDAPICGALSNCAGAIAGSATPIVLRIAAPR